METSHDFIVMVNSDPNFLHSVVMDDKAWNGSRRTPPDQKKVHLQKLKLKTLLITFFDCDGMIDKEFMPQGNPVDGFCYLGIMTQLLKCICHMSPKF